VVAVGECGLDYFRDLSPRPAQRAAFLAQLEMAARTGKPVFLHQRDAHADFTAILASTARRFAAAWRIASPRAPKSSRPISVSICRSASPAGCATSAAAAPCATAVPRIPRQKLLLETDAPYLLPRDLAPQPKSRRNEPAYLPHIAATVAALRGESLASVAEAATQNAVRLFGL
jgi:TatD DNase family protein